MVDDAMKRSDAREEPAAAQADPAADPAVKPVHTPADGDIDAAGFADAEADGAAEEVVELSLEEQLRRERDDFQDKWLRSVAELDNLRKRSRRELTETRRFATADIIVSLLEVVDNFERALQSMAAEDESQGELTRLRSGVDLIFQSLQNLLSERGVRKIEARGNEFDPQHHEAVGQLESDEVASGHVAEVMQQGYTLDDRVLRPSRVIVAK